MPWTVSLQRTRAGPDDVRIWLRWCRSGGRVRGLLPGGSGADVVVALVVDQLGEPADLAVDGVEAVALQLEGVAVQLLLGAAQRVPQPVALPLDGPPAAL